mmetsp:Transcript_23162/g.65660  ORF Transcript_23162/g.65660 Transcript_23162/m.65660 type:complete len:225 (+) Transcript_23162:101-775(+)
MRYRRWGALSARSWACEGPPAGATSVSEIMRLAMLCWSCSVRWLACLVAIGRGLARGSSSKSAPAQSDSWAVRHCSVTRSWTGGALAGRSTGASSFRGRRCPAKWSATTWTSSGSTSQTAALPSWCMTSRGGEALAAVGASGGGGAGAGGDSAGGAACSKRRSTSSSADCSWAASSRRCPEGYASGSKRQTATEAGGRAAAGPSPPRLARTGARGACCCSCARM